MSVIASALTDPVLDGTVTLDGIEIVKIKATSVDGNSRKMLHQEFDVAEMSFATYLKAKQDGIHLTGIPVFTGRRFLRPNIAISRASNIQSLSDLRGSKVGVPQYWMTSSVWHRGFLKDEYGIGPTDLRWVTVSPERLSTQDFPEAVSVVRKESDMNGLLQMLRSGEIDVMMSPKPIKLNDEGQHLVSPFEDIRQIQREYYSRTAIFPIMHFVVIGKQLEQACPEMAKQLFLLFQNAKATALCDLNVVMESPVYGETFEESKNLFQGDPWLYGLKSNRHVLETFLNYAVEQGLTNRRFHVEEVFAESTFDLVD